MDNASKALIIAGAVLIAVMLVSVGVLVYNRAMTTVNSALTDQDRLAIDLQNQKYTTYKGNSKGRDHVVQLLGVIRQEYLANGEHTVAVTCESCPSGASGGSSEADIKATMDAIQTASNYTYNITFETDASGYINKCKIVGKQ